jgi:3',5'-cyclic-nucleotide phosphodiesterase
MVAKGFDITVLGSKGGPLEGSTSSLLIKPSRLTFQEIISTKSKDKIIAIDAGVGLGRIAELISNEFNGEGDRLTRFLLGFYETQFDSNTNQQHVKVSSNSFNLKKSTLSAIQASYELFKLINIMLITHPHLDHVSALAINSPSFGVRSDKTVYGIPTTIHGLQDHIFNNLIWPDLVSNSNGGFLTLKELDDDSPTLTEINDSFKIKAFRTNHGCVKMEEEETYFSTAYLIQDRATDEHILVFGDVESDQTTSCSAPNSEANLKIWQYVSDLIIESKLNTIIIECSTPNQPKDVPLYGHLTPDLLYDELDTLNSLILEKLRLANKDEATAKPLKGFHCLVNHVKDIPFSGTDPKKVILDELNELERTNKLGLLFTVLLAGRTYTVNNE